MSPDVEMIRDYVWCGGCAGASDEGVGSAVWLASAVFTCNAAIPRRLDKKTIAPTGTQ
jgi:hypothetical protein